MAAHLRVEVNDDHCEPCQRLLGGLLQYPPARNDEDWESQLLGGAPIRCFRHHYCSFRALMESSKGSCAICRAVMSAVIVKSHVESSEQLVLWDGGDLPYQFWFKEDSGRMHPTNPTCTLMFGLGALSQYHTRRDRTALSIELYRRNGDDSDWRALHRKNIFGDEVWPSLAVRPNLDSGSHEVLLRTQGWLTKCSGNHIACQRPGSELPKRILDLLDLTASGMVRLYESQGETEPYVALSYCWGAAGALTTLRSNIQQHQRGITLDTFPRTLREAILFTAGLGIRYLWIDALCIIQDDVDDWAIQAAKMTEIYGFSTITLSATSSFDCDHGLFVKMTEDGIPVGRYHHPEPGGGQGTIFLAPHGPEGYINLDAEFLSTRGWTYQERAVPPRTLHFTDAGVLWECCEGYDQEAASTDWGKPTQKKEIATLFNSDPSVVPHDERSQYYETWNKWVCGFSTRKLTKITDKLPAMGGLAKALAPRLNDTYIAGIWASNFLDGLLWQRHYKHLSLARHEGCGIPSWSWASVTGNLTFWDIRPLPPKPQIDMIIHQINVAEQRAGSFGQIKPGGDFVAEGMLQLVTLDRSSEKLNPEGPFYPCRISDGMMPGIDIETTMDQMEYDSARDPYKCWCLRVCSYDGGACGMIAVLFLEHLAEQGNCFRRIGMGVIEILPETGSRDPEWNKIFASGIWTQFRLV
ncbi:hypothetical protein S40285_08836 [Stachybotrys chlorohalonatus IBT 40285]|uniref:Heterokaryon incompatibility domain-containing protein n=1 Tax=Stachybotrys chlorohalonatus (strain IBT 40285) TaxID=1283841 RepID=A0A084QW17_STAC4|nr:hypothetical protein S40285_08836 [Stachybotrys chlorohalonata IBT 40285]